MNSKTVIMTPITTKASANQPLHRSEALVHVLEAFVHILESDIDCCEALIGSPAHLLEALVGPFTHLLEPPIHRSEPSVHRVEPLRHAFVHILEPPIHRVEPDRHQLPLIFELLLDRRKAFQDLWSRDQMRRNLDEPAVEVALHVGADALQVGVCKSHCRLTHTLPSCTSNGHPGSDASKSTATTAANGFAHGSRQCLHDPIVAIQRSRTRKFIRGEPSYLAVFVRGGVHGFAAPPGHDVDTDFGRLNRVMDGSQWMEGLDLDLQLFESLAA